MNITLLHGYPDKVGRREIFAGFAKGPKSYVQSASGGDPVNPPQFQSYFDTIFPAMTVSGTYLVTFVPSLGGARPTWKAVWWTASGMTEVAGATDLSGETVQPGGFLGSY